jgi:hypothetical protein
MYKEEYPSVENRVVENLEEQRIPDNIPVEEPTNNLEVGVVTGCYRLNVREEPRADSEVVCVVDSGCEFLLDENESTDEFYKISTLDGIDGFCMKKFVTVRS